MSDVREMSNVLERPVDSAVLADAVKQYGAAIARGGVGCDEAQRIRARFDRDEEFRSFADALDRGVERVPTPRIWRRLPNALRISRRASKKEARETRQFVLSFIFACPKALRTSEDSHLFGASATNMVAG